MGIFVGGSAELCGENFNVSRKGDAGEYRADATVGDEWAGCVAGGELCATEGVGV